MDRMYVLWTVGAVDGLSTTEMSVTVSVSPIDSISAIHQCYVALCCPYCKAPDGPAYLDGLLGQTTVRPRRFKDRIDCSGPVCDVGRTVKRLIPWGVRLLGFYYLEKTT